MMYIGRYVLANAFDTRNRPTHYLSILQRTHGKLLGVACLNCCIKSRWIVWNQRTISIWIVPFASNRPNASNAASPVSQFALVSYGMFLLSAR